MNNSLLVGVVAGAVLVTAGGAFAGYKTWQSQHYAEVISAEPVTERVKTPRQDCHAETVAHQTQPKDEHRVAGTVIGAVVGGVLGNQVGGGSGKKLATVAGAAAGGYAGNRVQDRMQKGNTYETTEQHCQIVYDTEQRPAGYDVKYRLDGNTHTVRMDHDPGSRIPVNNGQLMLDSTAN